MRAKAFRLSATRLTEDNGLVAVCIPKWFRNALLDATERFTWSRVWTDDNDKHHELTASDIDKIEYAIFRLSTDEFCEELMPPITVEVNPVININTSSGGDGCCGYSPPPWQNTPMPGGTPNYPIPPVNPPINPVPIPPTAPPGTSQSEWDIYRCKLANYAFDQIRLWLVAVSEIPGTLVTIGAILILIWTLAPVGLLALVGTAVLELASVIFSWYALSEGIDEVAEFALEWWDDHQQSIVCQFYGMLDIETTRDSIVNEFLADLVTWAENRPWWIDSLANMLASVGSRMFPLQIFMAPWHLVPPTDYVGAIDCTLCQDDDEWGEHDRYIWVPLTNALLTEFSMSVIGGGQQNISSHTLTDDGHIRYSYTDADRADMKWETKLSDILASVDGSLHVAGTAWDFYGSLPLFSAGGSPYWYETMQGNPTAALDVTINDGYPKKWWVSFENTDDSDVNGLLQQIADYDGHTTIAEDEVYSNGEIQSGPSGARSGECRVRFLVKVE